LNLLDEVEHSWEWRAPCDDRNKFSVYSPPEAGVSCDTADMNHKNALLRHRAHRESQKRTTMDVRRSIRVRGAIRKSPLRTLRLCRWPTLFAVDSTMSMYLRKKCC